CCVLRLAPPPRRFALLPSTTLFRSPRSPRGAARLIVLHYFHLAQSRRIQGLAAARAGTTEQPGGCHAEAAAWSCPGRCAEHTSRDRKSTRLNSSHEWLSYAVFCFQKTRNLQRVFLTGPPGKDIEQAGRPWRKSWQLVQ